MEKSRATPSYELRTRFIQTFKRGLMARDGLLRVIASKPVIRWIFSNLVTYGMKLVSRATPFSQKIKRKGLVTARATFRAIPRV